MKKLYLILLLSCLSVIGYAQTAASYSFTATSGIFYTISGTGTSTTAISYDDSTLRYIPIGFTFNFCGTNYTDLSACSNGWLSLVNASSGTSFAAWSASYQNALSSLSSLGSGVGFLMPFWDDLWGTGHTAYYQTTGTAPYRKFIFEWSNWALFLDYTHYANMQVVLYETTNQIDYIYGTSSYPSRSATIGIANSTSDYKVLNNSGSSPTPSSSTFTTSIATFAANSQIYRFNPPPAACSGTPSAGTASASPIAVCGSNTINLSLTGYTLLSGVTYQWQVSADGSSWSNISGATNLYASTTETFGEYYRCNVTCTSTSSTGASASVFVPYTSGCYCIPNYTRAYASCDSLGVSIRGFHVNGTASTSINDVAHCTGTGYFDRTALSVYLFDGASYTATINGSATYNMNAQTWIDFNDDFTFQSTESVGGLNGYGATGTFTLAIPSGSSLGTHRMRVVSNAASESHTYASMNPCASGYALGDARDYVVTIFPVCSGTPTAGTPGTSVSPVCTGAPFTVSITGYTIASGISFQWQSSPDNSTWTTITGATNTSYTTTETSTTYFRCQVTCATSSVTTPSSSIAVNYLSTCYCTPAYSAPCGTTAISSMQLNGASGTVINDVATCVGSYQNRTALSASLYQGSTTNLYLGTYSTIQNAQTWIDFDNDGTFASSESVGGQNSFSLSAVYGIAIPSGAVTGSHRMRVVTNRTADAHFSPSISPCPTSGTYVGGETRDYTVVILTNICTGTPSAGTLSVSASSSCSSFTPTLTAVGHTAVPFVYYKWERSTDSTTWTTVSGATNSTYGATISSGTVYYRFVDSCGPSGLAGRSAGVRLVVNTVPTVGAIAGADSLCPGGTTIFSDTTAGGSWSVTNTTLATINALGLLTGLNGGIDTVNYSVTNTCGTTVSQRAILINPAPDAGLLSGPSSVCEGLTVTLSSTVSGGTWVATNSNATVTGGVVTGVTGGIDTILYIYTNTCGTDTSMRAVTIVALPSAGVIAGASTVCETSSTLLTDAAAGGTWSASNGNATVLGGNVTGITPGVDTIYYSVTNACSTVVAMHIITINPLPHAGTISGTATVCETATDTLTASGTTGGSWTATNAHASVTAGIVTGTTAGIDTIRYSVTNSCGTDVASFTITVQPAPNAGTILGSSTVCEGAAITLTDAAFGGFWTASNTNASVTAGSVLGIMAGVDTIAYTVTNSCGTAVATKIITINPLPHAGLISGAIAVCQYDTTTLTSSIAGGTWTMSNSNASINTTGMVTGLLPGTDTAIYTATNSCGSDIARHTLNINPAPPAGIISGAASVCQAATTVLTTTGFGGTWGVVTGRASVTGGTVTGITGGADTVTYTATNGCGTAVARHAIAVLPLLAAGTITGASTSVCVGDTISYSSAGGVSGGTWASSTGRISVTSAGLVRGIATGTTILSYTATNACGSSTDTMLITVNPMPFAGTISGASSVCEGGATVTLSTSGTTGGTWSLSNTNASASGATITGVTAGIDTVYYAVTNVCGTATAQRNITINPLPNAGTITSSVTSICAGSTTTYSDASGGGSWSSGSTTIASVNPSTGVIYGVSAGTTYISYTVTNGCGTASTSMAITVNPLPVAGTITGPSNGCLGTIVTLADGTGTSGGSWVSANPSIATVDATGHVFGASLGTTTITYLVTTATCGSAYATSAITINAVPYAGTIAGATAVCRGATTALTDVGGSTGGTWTTSSGTVASITPSTGVVTGMLAGTATITYTASTTYCGTVYATRTMTVNPLPVAGTISGVDSVCEAASVTLTDAIGTAGGIWTSANTAIATVNTSGTVTGVAAGTVLISYTAVTASCGTATTTFTMRVKPLPSAGTVTGVTSICPGTSTTLTSTVTGGVWTSTGLHTTHTGGVVTGASTGIDTIRYAVTNTCGTTTARTVVTVFTVPTGGAISGPTSVCAGDSVTLTESVAGGVWAVSSGIATVSAAGVVHGISGGTVTTTYTVTNVCGTAYVTRGFTVNSIVTPSVTMAVTPGTNVCVGDVITLSAVPVNGGSAPTYTWRNFGGYLGIGTTFTYSPSNGDALSVEMVSHASCISTTTVVSPTVVMTVNTVVSPVITISAAPGDTVYGSGAVVNFTSSVTNGGSAPRFQWYVSGAMIAGATNATFTHAFFSSETVYCELTSNAQCVTADRVNSNVIGITALSLGVKQVTSSISDLSLHPNPNNGSFVIKANASAAVTYDIVDVVGKVMQTGSITPQSGKIDTQVVLADNVTPGHYIVRVHTENGTEYLHFVKAE